MAVKVIQIVPQNGLRIDNNTISLSLTYVVESDEELDFGTVQTSGVPGYNDVCPLYESLKATSVNYRPMGQNLWEVDVEFTRQDDEENVSSHPESPWEDAPAIRYERGSEMVVETKYFDEKTREPKAILNSAGDLFENPPQVERWYLKISLTWKVRNFNPALVGKFEFKLNEDSVVIDQKAYPTGALLLTSLFPEVLKTPKGENYTRMTAEIIYKPWGHDFKPLQAGFNARNDQGVPLPVRQLDNGEYTVDQKQGKPIQDAILLNKEGRLLATTRKGMLLAEPVFASMRYMEYITFSSLGIPSIKAYRKTGSSR